MNNQQSRSSAEAYPSQASFRSRRRWATSIAAVTIIVSSALVYYFIDMRGDGIDPNPGVAWLISVTACLVFAACGSQIMTGHLGGLWRDRRNHLYLSSLQMAVWIILVGVAYLIAGLFNLHQEGYDEALDIGIDFRAILVVAIASASALLVRLVLAIKSELLVDDDSESEENPDITKLLLGLVTVVCATVYGIAIWEMFKDGAVEGQILRFPTFPTGLLYLFAISHITFIVRQALPSPKLGAPPNTNRTIPAHSSTSDNVDRPVRAGKPQETDQTNDSMEANAGQYAHTPARDIQNPKKNIIKRIGLLVVHGIGEQNRHQHLQEVTQRLVRAASVLYGKERVYVEMFPGVDQLSVVSILIRESKDRDDFACIDLHEVWWRDLNPPVTPWSVIKFWTWAATFAGTRGRFLDDTDVTTSPTNRNTLRKRVSVKDRFSLFMRITYFFILLFPIRVTVQLVNILPGIRPINLFRTIFSYMSVVQLYQQRRGRIGGTLSDFDHSIRISIQRRFANALVDMASRKYNRWYVMGHSLGSVIALKGLMYPADSFARFMSFNRWHDSGFPYRCEVSHSPDYPDKPYRPGWLSKESALDTSKILEDCRGFVSWGSPLEIFARTWPEMVHLNKQPPFQRKRCAVSTVWGA